MIIRKSLFVLLKNLLLILLITIVFIVIFGLIAHSTPVLSNISHEQLFFIDSFVFILPSVISFIAFLITTLRWRSENYNFEENLLVHKHGVLNQQIRHFPLENIESISFKQNFLGKTLNYGSIYLIGSEKHKNIEISNVDAPEECYQYLKELINKNHTASFNEMHIEEIISHSENENIEFKSTFRWDLTLNKINKILEKTIMKTIAGFMNSDGGILVIGIEDNGTVIGLVNDYNTLLKKSPDGFANFFTQKFNAYIGLEYRYLVKMVFHKITNKDVCALYINPSEVPVYLQDGEQQEFYIRTGNSTNMLNVKESNAYIGLHWHK